MPNNTYVAASEDHVTMTHSGTIVQIQSNGDVFIHSTNNAWNISDGKSYDIAKTGKEIVVQGGNFNIRVNGNCNLFVDGDLNQTVTGDYNLGVGKRFLLAAGEAVEIQGAKTTLRSYADLLSLVGKDVSISSFDGITLSGKEVALNADEKGFLSFGGDLNMKSGGNINADASGIIDMQNGSAGTSKGRDAEVMNLEKMIPSASISNSFTATTKGTNPRVGGYLPTEENL